MIEAPIPADESNAVAIVGMAARLPGAWNVEEYWKNLVEGVESIRRYDDEALIAAGELSEHVADPRYVRAGGELTGYDEFDADFFGLSAREASILDPQHRIFLECAWHALEDAGRDPGRFDGRVGVFGGTGMNAYYWLNLRDGFGGALSELEARLSNDRDFLTTLVSYKLGLEGPSVGIQTACSTSLVAIHFACQSLLVGECDMVLAGGATVLLPHGRGYVHREGDTTSPDGVCRPFDARPSGLVGASGAGVVALRRLADAQRDGDPIRAVVAGSAVTNDGGERVGYTAPGVSGQAAAITEALGMAGVEPSSISFVETHGTGTRVGDPIEVQALSRALGSDRETPCALGSVKANIGHCDAAAGVASLIKAVLSLEHRIYPGNPVFGEPNPLLRLEETGFTVSRDNLRLPDGVLHAGVSSFGMGGTNAHVVLRSPPQDGSPERSQPDQGLLCVSARSRAALNAATQNLADHLEKGTAASLDDIALTTQVGRRAFEWRLAAVAEGQPAFGAAALRSAGPGRRAHPHPRAVFLFPGQGAQKVGMAGGLWDSSAVFRDRLEECCHAMPDSADGARLLRLVTVDEDSSGDGDIQATEFAQPALFAVEWALASTLASYGVAPVAMVGHSIGEYVAACLAGVFTLEDAVAVVAARGRLMSSASPGGMLAVAASEIETKRLVRDAVEISGVNGPNQTVVAGTLDAIAEACDLLDGASVRYQALATSGAFHSKLMRPAAEALRSVLTAIPLGAPSVAVYSNVTGGVLTEAQATDPDYWARQVTQPVRLSEALAEVSAMSDAVLAQVGPGQVLTRLAVEHGVAPERVVALDGSRAGSSPSLLHVIGALWEAGLSPDWDVVNVGRKARRTRLPAYPFERRRHWVDAPDTASGGASSTNSDSVTLSSNGGIDSPPTDDAISATLVAGVFAEAFGLHSVEQTADFFQLGGSSLSAIEVVDSLRQLTGVRVGLELLYATPRADELAQRLTELQAEGPDLDALADELLVLDPDELAALLNNAPRGAEPESREELG